LYKCVGLNRRFNTIKDVVKALSVWKEYGREIAQSSIVAVLLVALLSGVSYYLFPQYSSSIGPTPSFVYAWVKGNESQTGNVYENKTVLWKLLDFEFSFVNGSSIHEPGEGEKGEEQVIRLEYHGELDATDLLKIVIRQFSVIIGGVKDMTIGQVHIETFTHEDNTTDYLEAHGNFSISVSLRSIDVIDLGTLKLIDWVRDPSSDSGYWKNGAWTMDADQLSSMLLGSGTALIVFDAAVNVHVKYEITVEGITKTGENDLSWEGSMGTIEITYDLGKLLYIRYDFESIKLQLLKVP